LTRPHGRLHRTERGGRRKILMGKFTLSIWSLANHWSRAFRRSSLAVKTGLYI